MTVVISKLYVKTFEENVRHLAQQTMARLRPYVTEKAKTTSSHSFPRMAAQSMSQKTSPRTATPQNDSTWSNRVATPATYHGGDSVEPEDLVQMLVDPQSNIAISLAAAARRQIDDIIISAATGSALDEAGNSNTFPSGQSLGSSTQAFDFPFVTSIGKKFLDNNIDPDEPKVLVVSPWCMQQALAWQQATNKFFVDRQALALNGFIPNFCGFDWVVSTRLAVPGSNQRTILAFTKRAIGLLAEKDIWARAAERPDESFNIQLYTALTMGAVRVEDEHIVQGTILEQ